jgi:hypothetical protein
MTWTDAGLWLLGVPGRMKARFAALRISRVCFPMRMLRRRTLRRVGRVIADRLFVVQEDWLEHLEDQKLQPDYAEARNRARVREVNAILNALQREFPGADFPDGVDPFDMQELVNTRVTPRQSITPISGAKAARTP